METCPQRAAHSCFLSICTLAIFFIFVLENSEHLFLIIEKKITVNFCKEQLQHIVLRSIIGKVAWQKLQK